MDKKAAIVGGLAAVTALVAVVALTRKPAEAAPPPPPDEYKYLCIYGDGFKTKTWEEMLAHYQTAHPDQPPMSIVEIKWV